MLSILFYLAGHGGLNIVRENRQAFRPEPAGAGLRYENVIFKTDAAEIIIRSQSVEIDKGLAGSFRFPLIYQCRDEILVQVLVKKDSHFSGFIPRVELLGLRVGV